MIGAIVGDIVGSVYEWNNIKTKDFPLFRKDCGESVNVTHSMSKAGYPYDSAPMERYFNTLKNECINLYEFKTEDELYRAVEEFAYAEYNYSRPHSANDYLTPAAARHAA